MQNKSSFKVKTRPDNMKNIKDVKNSSEYMDYLINCIERLESYINDSLILKRDLISFSDKISLSHIKESIIKEIKKL